MVAAEPQPVAVREEWQDGTVKETWENIPPQIEELQEKILSILNREGRSLLALNALFQAREAQVNLAQKTLSLRQEEAEAIIWKYSKYKAIAVAVNPIAIADVLGASVADLALIRSLSRLYGLPMTNFEAGKLWQKILVSSGGLLLGELAGSVVLGFGKSGAIVAGGSLTALTSFATTALTQGAIAGYGSYAVGKAAQEYLERGCSWGDLGASTVIEEILSQVEPNTIIYRLRQELSVL